MGERDPLNQELDDLRDENEWLKQRCPFCVRDPVLQNTSGALWARCHYCGVQHMFTKGVYKGMAYLKCHYCVITAERDEAREEKAAVALTAIEADRDWRKLVDKERALAREAAGLLRSYPKGQGDWEAEMDDFLARPEVKKLLEKKT
ncbi:MAG: hypothetical protein V3W32_06870 [Gemmatimonadota bacterium]